jgi:4-amino-4-deoxy-L-arabinose transferase-like glycosyltransferase
MNRWFAAYWHIGTITGVFLLINLWTLSSYGVSWDEPLHMTWTLLIKNYFHGGFVGQLDLPGNGMYYAPGYFLLNSWVTAFAVHAFQIPAWEAIHLLNVVVASGALLIVGLFAKRLMNERIAIMTMIILAFYPAFIAHAHYNPKDIPLMGFFAAILWSFYEISKHMTRISAVIGGIVLGLALASVKITVLVALPVFALPFTLHVLRDDTVQRTKKEKGMRIAQLLGIGGIVTLVTTWACWPLLWHDPMLFFRSITFFLRGDFWSGSVLYFGHLYKATELPWHYIPVSLWIATPILTFVVACGGFIVAVKNIGKNDHRYEHLLIVTWCVLPLLLSLKPGLARYDGMRQFFFVVPAIAMLAGIGFNELWIRLKKIHAYGPIVCSIIMIAWLLIEVVRVHPYEGSYVNEIVRTAIPHTIDAQLEIEYWGPTYLEGLEWLKRHAGPSPTICVPQAGQLILYYQDLWRDDFAFSCEEGAFDYLMIFTRSSTYTEKETAVTSAKDPVFTIRRYNTDLLKIYSLR